MICLKNLASFTRRMVSLHSFLCISRVHELDEPQKVAFSMSLFSN